MFKRLSFFILLYVSFCNAFGQQNTKAIRVIARPMPDSIILRWAPTSFDIWLAGNKSGYIIERYTLLKDGNLTAKPQGITLTTVPLKPLPLKQWEPLSTNDDYVGVAAQAIYGESFEVSAQKQTGVMDIINKATEQENRFTFALFAADQSPIAAKASGLWFTDKNVKKGESYLYKVLLAAPGSLITDTGYVYISVDDHKPLPKPYNLKASFSDKMVLLTWNKQGIEQYYTGFFIEKSNDGGKTFVPVNKKPFINPEQENADKSPFYFYIDSLHGNDNQYLYRIYGVSPFGEKSPLSDTVSGNGIEKIKDNPHIVIKEIIQGSKVKLTWEFPFDKTRSISGFKVLRSKSDEKGYQIISGIIPPSNRTFTDSLPMPVNYYKILAFKDGGSATLSLSALVQMPDSIPPEAPAGLVAKADTTGNLWLRWKANTEPDIYGYRIYRGNNENEEFSQLTVAPITDTVFVDKINLKTLTKHVYYQVLAVDKRQNYSRFSKTLEVERPDIVPPLAPLIENMASTDKGNKIFWVNSTSNDVASHTLYRKEKGGNLWKTITALNNDTTKSALDSTAQSGILYGYALKAKDKSGLESVFSNTVYCKTLNKNLNNALQLTYKVDREKNTIQIFWPPVKGARLYQIYRALDQNPLSLYKSIEVEIATFTDNQISQNSSYTYSIKILNNDGTYSGLSSSVNVKF